jgi:hypothetical protein
MSENTIKLDLLPRPEVCEGFRLPPVDYWNRYLSMIAEFLRFNYEDGREMVFLFRNTY